MCPYCKFDLNCHYLSGTKTLGLAHSFYDSNGKFHMHDNSKETSQFLCPCGKVFTEDTQKKCWCGWPDNQDFHHPAIQDLSYHPG